MAIGLNWSACVRTAALAEMCSISLCLFAVVKRVCGFGNFLFELINLYKLSVPQG